MSPKWYDADHMYKQTFFYYRRIVLNKNMKSDRDGSSYQFNGTFGTERTYSHPNIVKLTKMLHLIKFPLYLSSI